MDGIKPIVNKSLSSREGSSEEMRRNWIRQNEGFQEIFEKVKERTALSLSKHAQGRMADRNIGLNRGQVERLNTAVERARQKGVQDTLVLMDDTAFIINIKSTTVVTAVKRDALKDKVFTNIDGAVIL